MGIDLLAGEVLYRKGRPVCVMTDGEWEAGQVAGLRLYSIPTRTLGCECKDSTPHPVLLYVQLADISVR